jgi:hypothetical protein
MPSPNRIPIAELNTIRDCLAYVKTDLTAYRCRLRNRRSKTTNSIEAYMVCSYNLSALRKLEQLIGSAEQP